VAEQRVLLLHASAQTEDLSLLLLLRSLLLLNGRPAMQVRDRITIDLHLATLAASSLLVLQHATTKQLLGVLYSVTSAQQYC
jgi:hypothetical protein